MHIYLLQHRYIWKDGDGIWETAIEYYLFKPNDDWEQEAIDCLKRSLEVLKRSDADNLVRNPDDTLTSREYRIVKTEIKKVWELDKINI